MAANIIDGRKIAERIKLTVKRDIRNIKAEQKTAPELAMLEIGKNPTVEIYLKSQIKLADELGIKYHPMILPAKTSQREIEQKIDRLNNSDNITGIIIQRPLPRHIDFARLCAFISPNKDVEGLNPINIGNLVYEDWIVAPCTASACMALIDDTGINLYGKEVVIIGHSEIVGKPLSLMLLSRMATTTVCHIGTYQKRLLKSHVQRAEVLIVSVGKSHLIKGDWIRKGALVIDVGINRHKGKVTGDVDFKGAVKRASYITPVPGGVGPVTTIMLMKNLMALYKNRVSQKCRP
jgi:methylenetetrahydrofolate dehydrogenase (NADP+)/methenyltetrahydrofolate cyclohydrolase